MNEYNPKEIESKWQKIWDEQNYGKSKDFSDKPKFYSLIEFPYPSGAGLHVGHCMMYSATDAHARMMRMCGYNVMFPMGWDAFGLPTENFAIKNKVKPADVTASSIATFKRQQKSLGYSFDWSREINTTDPEYYKWTQWIFLQFYKHAYNPHQLPLEKGESKRGLIEIPDDDTTTPRLAFQAEMPVNWCPSCKIVLANEEVVNGSCERCGAQAIKRKQKQWMLRITAYAERLIDDLKLVDFPEQTKTMQKNWIGKSVGAEIEFRIKNDEERIRVFTTRADTLFGCTYIVLSPEYMGLKNLESGIKNKEEVEKYISDAKKKSDLERAELQKEKTGVKLEGLKAINPINSEEVYIYVADYVLASYGTGAVMAVPAHDERDFEFAKKYNIDVKTAVIPAKAGIQKDEIDSRVKPEDDIIKEPFTDYGVLINSGEFNGLSSEEAKKKITEKLKEIGAGDFTTNFKLRDWIFSRQHYWGEPIPIIHCEKCGMVPVPESDLPVVLPDVENYLPTETGESPLAKISDWVETTCPKCGGDARRETDTMPNWAGSSWYFLAYAMNKESGIKNYGNKGNIFSDKISELKYWMPVDLYNGGAEHTTLHLLYSRFWHKFLYDLKVVNEPEPYKKRVVHGLILGPDGQKMSKSRGNVINPDEMVEKFGADTLRAYIMFIGPYDQESAWSMAGIQGVSRFLKRVWKSFDLVDHKKDDDKVLVKLNQTIAGVTYDLDHFKLNTVISKLMEFLNLLEKAGHISEESFATFLKLLYPAAPHIASELWTMVYPIKSPNFDGEIEWPKVNEKYLAQDKNEIVVQINGKVKDKFIISSDATDKELEDAALQSPKVVEYIKDREIIKIIVISGKLVSIVIKN